MDSGCGCADSANHITSSRQAPIPAEVGHQEIALGDGHERVQARGVRINLYPK